MGDNLKSISYSSAAQFRLSKRISLGNNNLRDSVKNQEDNNNPETLKRINSISTKILSCALKSIINPPQEYYLSKIRKQGFNPKSAFNKHITSSFKFFKKYQNLTIHPNAEKLQMPQHKKYYNKKTILLDLDETIIHSTQDDNANCDLRVPMTFPNGKTINAGIYIRPYALEMLKNLSKYFQIIIFTASHPFYADPILNALDPQNQLFSYRLYRQHCVYLQKDTYAKDLRIVPRNPSQIVIVDNSPISYILQPENGVPITSYFSQYDTELQDLQQYLMKLAYLVDVKNMNSRTFKFDQYKKFETVQDLISSLYSIS